MLPFGDAPSGCELAVAVLRPRTRAAVNHAARTNGFAVAGFEIWSRDPPLAHAGSVKTRLRLRGRHHPATNTASRLYVPRAELRAAGLAHAVVAHSPAAAFVHEQDRRPPRIDVAVAELHQRDDHRPEVQALLGQAVLVPNWMLLVGDPVEDAVLDERVQAVGQNIAGGACPAL